MKKSIIISTIIVVILLAGYAVNHFSYSTSSSEIETAWQAYEGFNNNLLDKNKYIYKTNTSYTEAKDRWNGAAAIWCQPIYWDMAMNAYKLACKTNDNKRKKELLGLNRKIFEV